MKYIIVLSDGMAGEALEELAGRTTMEAAVTPNMDRLARDGQVGLARMVPKGMSPGSDTANLSVLGYDPRLYYTGRSPLEALSIGVDMKESDISFRCNLVTLSEEEGDYDTRRILDHSAGEISTSEAALLFEALKEGLHREGYRFYTGTSYRHLLIWEQGQAMELVPPHDILTREIREYLPADPVLCEMMRKSYAILNDHPVNRKRREQGQRPANSIWFWGAGTRPGLTSFVSRTGKKGVMISAVDLLKGIAVGAGMTNIEVDGANGGLHTNYEGKADAAVKALLCEGYDFAYIHVEAPDEMGHQGLTQEKITAIESVDQKVVGTLTSALDTAKEAYRLLILPDHPTPIAARTHTADPVPWLLYDSTNIQISRNAYNEKSSKASGLLLEEGYKLIDCLLEN